MPYLALKELKYHRRTYQPGEAFPDSIGRWPDLRHFQRRGFVSKTRVEVAPTQPTEPTPTEPEAVAPVASVDVERPPFKVRKVRG